MYISWTCLALYFQWWMPASLSLYRVIVCDTLQYIHANTAKGIDFYKKWVSKLSTYVNVTWKSWGARKRVTRWCLELFQAPDFTRALRYTWFSAACGRCVHLLMQVLKKETMTIQVPEKPEQNIFFPNESRLSAWKYRSNSEQNKLSRISEYFIYTLTY